eukprot:PhF_6_TR18901/c0_g1_i6/m.27561
MTSWIRLLFIAVGCAVLVFGFFHHGLVFSVLFYDVENRVHTLMPASSNLIDDGDVLMNYNVRDVERDNDVLGTSDVGCPSQVKGRTVYINKSATKIISRILKGTERGHLSTCTPFKVGPGVWYTTDTERRNKSSSLSNKTNTSLPPPRVTSFFEEDNCTRPRYSYSAMAEFFVNKSILFYGHSH